MTTSFGGDPQAPTGLAAPERNRYYYGKLLDVPHFQMEQQYLNGKRWLLNRLLDGPGVIAGLGIVPTADGSGLILQAGVAIDGWGREIIVPAASVAFDPRTLTDQNGKSTGTITGAGAVTISLCYQACGVDPAPVMIANCKPDGDCEPGTTREQYVLSVQSGNAVPSPTTCGFADIFRPVGGPTDIPDPHAALAARVTKPNADPVGAGCVLLAQVDLPASGTLTTVMIDTTVRPVVLNAGTLLELIFCLAQRVQELSTSGATPPPTPTPTPTPTA
jgi:hypothetical protein